MKLEVRSENKNMKLDLVATVYIFFDDKVLLIHHKKLNTWLPLGGHIEEDETPDDTVKREVKEEVNLDIEILNQSQISKEGNVVKKLALPFDVDVHNVGNHNHCSFFYIAEAINPNDLKINNELKNFRWFNKKDLLDENIVPINIKNQAEKAFEIYNKLKINY